MPIIQISKPDIYKPKAIFYCGTNGSGKSTLRRFSDDDVNVIIDSDKIAAQLMVPNSNIRAGKYAIDLFNQCIDDRIGFSLETTLSGVSSLERIKNAKDAGFEVIIKYVGLRDLNLNILRVEERVKNGGHNIPTQAIKRRYITSRLNLNKVFLLADYLYIYDNSYKTISWQLFTHNNIIYTSAEYENWVEDLKQELLLCGYTQGDEKL